MSFLSRYHSRTNVFWSKLEAGWTASQRAMRSGAITPYHASSATAVLGICNAGCSGVGAGRACRLPVTSIFSLPVGLGMHIGGTFHAHWTALVSADRACRSPPGAMFCDTALQDTNHWLPQVPNFSMISKPLRRNTTIRCICARPTSHALSHPITPSHAQQPCHILNHRTIPCDPNPPTTDSL